MDRQRAMDSLQDGREKIYSHRRISVTLPLPSVTATKLWYINYIIRNCFFLIKLWKNIYIYSWNTLATRFKTASWRQIERHSTSPLIAWSLPCPHNLNHNRKVAIDPFLLDFNGIAFGQCPMFTTFKIIQPSKQVLINNIKQKIKTKKKITFYVYEMHCNSV
jgi:hypothetical protein